MASSKRDLHVGFYYPKVGAEHASGKAIYVREMATALSTSCSVSIYTRAADAFEGDGTSVDAIQIPTNGTADVLDGRLPVLGDDDVLSLESFVGAVSGGVTRHIDRRVDVLLTHYYLDDLLLSRVVDVPIAYQYHGLQQVGIGARARERLSRTPYHLANAHTTASEVDDAFGHGVDDVVYPGVDLDRFHPDAEPAFEHDEPVVMFVGRLVRSKGVYDLIDAFARASPEARLYLVGDGDVAGVRAAVRERGIGDAVTMVGEVPHDELHRYYAACDVLCYPSYYDSFGLVNLEAMACGKPVVTTDVSGIDEYAEHGETALLVPPGRPDDLAERVSRLVESPALRERLGAAGRRTAREYGWGSASDELRRFCESIARQSA